MPEHSKKNIFFVTGASGVGKTTLINQLEIKYYDKKWAFLHFDKIGVPPLEEMIRDFGSGAKWQEAKTYEWIEKLIRTNSEKIFFEGQVNLEFIRKGFSKHGFTGYTITLVDCDQEVMKERLVNQRNQPGLFTPEMINWLKFLRKQAIQFNVPIINNSYLSEAELLTKFEETINLSQAG